MKILNITLASVLLSSVSYGAVPYNFSKGEVISAQKMNENFSVLDSKVSAIPQGEKGDTGAQGLQGLKGDEGSQGAQGVVGPKGDTGSQGPQGVVGPAGDTGATGATGINWQGLWAEGIDYSTNDAIQYDGSSYICLLEHFSSISLAPPSEPYWELIASVGAVGDTGAQGEQGLQGLKGDEGSQGAQGVVGPAGDTGAQGIQGHIGATGLQGAQGSQGVQGDKGDQGLQGVRGDTGSQGVQGPQGLKGDTGSQGIQGIAGSKGDKGDTGSQGLQGVKGDTGDQGIQGEQGIIGLTGPSGTSKWNDGVDSVTSTARVGIGVTEPKAMLDIDGYVKLAKYNDPPVVCDSLQDGTIVLTTSYKTCVCNGVEWILGADGRTECVKDCAGVWGGDMLLDDCDICDTDPVNDCMQNVGGLIWQAGTAATVVAEAQVLIPGIQATYPHGAELSSSAAATFCESLSYGMLAVNNWRLPTDTELLGLVGDSLQSFTDLPYWSSTIGTVGTHKSVSFQDGSTADTPDTDMLYVRCVRDI